MIKLIGTTLEKTFCVKYGGKNYYITYLNSDYPDPCLINRTTWEILDENGEEMDIYCFKSDTKREIKQIKLNKKRFDILIKFCIKNFNFYRPSYRK